jgi:hypothetical protein
MWHYEFLPYCVGNFFSKCVKQVVLCRLQARPHRSSFKNYTGFNYGVNVSTYRANSYEVL